LFAKKRNVKTQRALQSKVTATTLAKFRKDQEVSIAPEGHNYERKWGIAVSVPKHYTLLAHVCANACRNSVLPKKPCQYSLGEVKKRKKFQDGEKLSLFGISILSGLFLVHPEGNSNN